MCVRDRLPCDSTLRQDKNEEKREETFYRLPSAVGWTSSKQPEWGEGKVEKKVEKRSCSVIPVFRLPVQDLTGVQ